MNTFDSEGLRTRRKLLTVGIGSTAAALLGSSAKSEDSTCTCESDEIRELLHKQSITELIYQYPRALDRHDRDLLMSIGHPDATVQFRDTLYSRWADFVDWLMDAHDPMLANNHRITNILIKLKGDRAVSESSGTATLLVRIDDNTLEERWMHSRYLDKWSRRNGQWALQHRQTLTDYRRLERFPASEFDTRYSTIGERSGRDDLSYAHFDSLTDLD